MYNENERRLIFLAYTAGFFDADGSVGIYRGLDKRRKGIGYLHRLQTKIIQANWLPIMDEWQAMWGGTLWKGAPSGNQSRPVWHWILSSRQAMRFLIDIQPFARNKLAQIDLAIEFQKRKTHAGKRKVPAKEFARRLAMAEKMKALKRQVRIRTE